MFSGADTDHVKVVIWSNCLIYTKSENMVSKSGKIGEIIKKKIGANFHKVSFDSESAHPLLYQ